jgi:hypothetical protein
VLRHGENARQGQDCCYFQEGCSHFVALRENARFRKPMNKACFAQKPQTSPQITLITLIYTDPKA